MNMHMREVILLMYWGFVMIVAVSTMWESIPRVSQIMKCASQIAILYKKSSSPSPTIFRSLISEGFDYWAIYARIARYCPGVGLVIHLKCWPPLCRADFFLEIMKSGQIIEKEPLRGKSHFTIGKIPTCDLVQQHPSISRLHAILQFQGDKAGPQLFDTGSLHGSFVNKKQIKPKTYVPLRYLHPLHDKSWTA